MTKQSPLILIIDDEPEFLEIFSLKLGAAGYGVETAQDGEEGIRKAKKTKPDLILLDMKMPEMSGADVITKLKGDPATKGIKVVFLSNYGDPREGPFQVNRRLSQEIGAMDYLKKVDDLDALVDKVKLFLQ